MSPKSYINLITVLVLLNLSIEHYHGSEGKNNKIVSKEEDMELDMRLKILNKTPVKSIKTKLGDIYDCINIYKQPAFDHPLLKNHKIQMKPSVIREEQIDKHVYNMVSSVERYKIEGCPLETVPIRRTSKEELINAKYLNNWIKPRHSVSAEIFAEKAYYGGKASITNVNPRVEMDQFSTAQIWIQNGPTDELNSIEFGWAVYPQLFGDNLTRVFGLWTVPDGFKNTGCYNMVCPGFVQVHPKYTFGEYIEAEPYGEKPTWFDFSVYRDLESGNWWFVNGFENAEIGYWPKEIFTHLANNASTVRFGGVAGGDPGEPTPPMGHGYLPDYNDRYTCTIQEMKIVNDQGNFVDFDTSNVQLKNDTKTSCYDLIFIGKEVYRGITMFFGGPGGDCP
ncbi:hypothetical protein MKW92_007979 [Papaver armeniacum]|nr:hypothetical protein MKW92_007979 [Papaver armeniacum]